jgi:hypothetical protein
MTTPKTAPPPEAPEYPAWWSFDEDGKAIEGTFVRAGSGYTQNGPRPFVVLDVDVSSAPSGCTTTCFATSSRARYTVVPTRRSTEARRSAFGNSSPATIERGTRVHRLPDRVPRGARVDAGRHLRGSAGGVTTAGDRGCRGRGAGQRHPVPVSVVQGAREPRPLAPTRPRSSGRRGGRKPRSSALRQVARMGGAGGTGAAGRGAIALLGGRCGGEGAHHA